MLPPGKRSIARFIFVYTPLTFYILSVVYVMERLSAAKPPSKNDDAEDMMTRMAGWRRQQQQQQQQQQNSCNNKKVPPTIIPLSKLTKIESSRSSFSCTKDGLVWIENRETTRPTATTINTNNTSGIPKLIHQTSRTRCLTVDFAQLTRRWKEWGEKDGWSYYFHDDEAMQRLYHHASSSSDEFPNMMLPIFQHCLLHGTARADLWRYLLLYIYGGIYADLDTVPDLLTTDMIAWSHQQQQQQHDALFVVEQYHLLSQYFMAVTPRHPLMWYALQHAVLNVAKATDTGQLAAAMMTGPHALHQAYQSFRADVGVFVEPAVPGRKPV